MPRPICPECQSKQVLYRLKTNSFLCRRCGHKWGKKETKQATATGKEH